MSEDERGVRILNVTDKAAEVLHQTLELNQEDESDVLRVTRGQDGLGLAVGKGADGDQLVDHDGRTVLAIDGGLSAELDGATIDLQQTPEGTRLVFQPSPA